MRTLKSFQNNYGHKFYLHSLKISNLINVDKASPTTYILKALIYEYLE